MIRPDDLINLANPGVAGISPYKPGKPIAELELELGISNIIKLASNENPLGPSTRVIEGLANLADLSRYPDGNGHRLKAALAEYHDVTPAQITLGNGSNEIFELLARAVADQRHEIIFSEYAFAVYPLVTQAIGARAVIVPAVNWQHDITAMQAAINERSRIMFIANPNNPTGTWVDGQALRTLLEGIHKHILVVVDEAYFDYVQEDGYSSCMQWVHEFPQLLVTRTFSKIFGLAALRIGYAVSHSAIADLMNRVRQPFNVNSLALSAAETALADEAHIRLSIDLNLAGMQQLISTFDKLGLQYIPSVGNFICVNIGPSSLKVYQKLLYEGVIVRPLDSYGMSDHLRITIGTQEENEKFIHALEKILAGIDIEE